MSKNQKPKMKTVKVETDGKASSIARNDKQVAQMFANRARGEEASPWEKAKEKRLGKRLRAGKTYANFAKASTYKQSGPHSVSDSRNGKVGDSKVHPEKRGRIERDSDARLDKAIRNSPPVVKDNGDISYLGGVLEAGVDF